MQFFDQEWTLAAAAAQAKPLIYLPLPYSEHVLLNGVRQTRGTDFTIAGQTLNVLAAMDARVGDLLAVEYAYSGGVPTTPANGVAPPGAIIYDSFNRANATTLGTPDLGPDWTYFSKFVPSEWAVNNNVCKSTGTREENYARIVAGVSDYHLTATLAALPSGGDGGFIFRDAVSNASNSLYVMNAEVGSRYAVYLGGPFGNFTFLTAVGGPPVLGDVMHVRVVGTAGTAWVNNGTPVAFTVQNALTTTVGLRANGPAAHSVSFDEFLVVPP